MMATTLCSDILYQVNNCLSRILTQTDLRRQLLSDLRSRYSSTEPTDLQTLTLASETLESAISIGNPSARSSTLRLAEKLILSDHTKSKCSPSLSAFLLSLIYSLTHQPVSAALSMMDLFYLEPSLARSEIAPRIFEELFLVHLIPVLEQLNSQRQNILTISTSNISDTNFDDFSYEMSVVFPTNKLLSSVTGDQGAKLKQLEESYEAIIDENCRVFAQYFKEVLRDKNGGNGRSSKAPSVVLQKISSTGYDKLGFGKPEEKKSKTGQISFKHGRYNPIWSESEISVELRSDNPRSSYPQRVSAEIFTKSRSQNSLLENSIIFSSDSEEEEEDENLAASTSSESESEAEAQEKNIKGESLMDIQRHKQKGLVTSAESSSSTPDRSMSDPGKSTPPKDFVCPITSTVFDDPVTLETGQTYERRAIREWLERGNSTCPITRQQLNNTKLPKTNYVLKRLIDSWQDQNPGTRPDETRSKSPTPTMPSNSPNSVISSLDGTILELRNAITRLCMSEILKESEAAVLRIERYWQEAILEEAEMEAMLTKPPVVNGFVEILFNSVEPKVLKATIFLLCELGSRDKSVVNTLTQVDSDVDCIVTLFKKGVEEAVVLIHLLGPSGAALTDMDLVESLLRVITRPESQDGDSFNMCMKPKTASVLLLGQIIDGSEESDVSAFVASSVISYGALESVMKSLDSDSVEERIATIGILVRCIQEDGKCRNLIAEKAEFAPILESFVGASDEERFEIVQFLSELVKLNRRSFNEQVLQIIKEEGPLSTMHTLLNYLQTASPEQCPVVAGLLLQLDLLAEPRKMSIFREEAIDSLILCLKNTEFPSSQIAAADTIISMQGRFSFAGQPLAHVFILKHAGLDKKYRSIMRAEKLVAESDESLKEEEKAAEDWERRTAYALVSHEFGLIFEALEEGLKSRYGELCSACFDASVWLVHMLTVIPDTGVRGAARVCLLKRLVSIFKSAKDVEDRALAMLALSSFIKDTEGLKDLTPYMKDVLRGLREIRKYSPLAVQMLKLLSQGSESSVDLWHHKELAQVDCSSNGEVLSVVCFKDKIISGHSDGTIKVWTGKGSVLHLIQEVKEHAKAVTSLAVLPTGERLHSGSLDRTVRVWSIGTEAIHCVQVHDMKDHVNNLVVANSIACFIPQGAGVKVHSWNGGSKLMNPNKYVKCLSLGQGKLYCGCTDNSIQEIDLATGTLSSIQSGSRKLLGKSNVVYTIQVNGGLLYSAGNPLDGATVKIWNVGDFELVGSLPSALEVRCMAVSSELIYLGCKGGNVEIWCKEKLNRVDTLHIGSNTRINSVAIDAAEEFMVVGTSDGLIQAWGLS